MHLALYVGQGLQRTELIAFAAPLIAALADRLTLIAPITETSALVEAMAQIQPADHIQVQRWCQENHFTTTILTAIQHDRPDLLLIPAFGARTTPMSWRWRRLELNLLGSLSIPFLRVHGRIKPIRQIALASAGGAQSLRSVPLISQLARVWQAEITVMHVVSQELLYFDGFPSSPLTEATALRVDEQTRVLLQQIVVELHRQGISARLQVLNGLVEETIIAECQHYDLLVIGSHQAEPDPNLPPSSWLWLLQRISLQDVTRNLLDRSPIPVLVV
ncbi:MAG: universal stress protein [Chloroflexus sp.]